MANEHGRQMQMSASWIGPIIAILVIAVVGFFVLGCARDTSQEWGAISKCVGTKGCGY